jgi:hypothetical protein
MGTPTKDTTDPFAPAEVAKPEPVAVVAPDLAKFEQLRELVRAEGRLADQGKTCYLKDPNWDRPACIGCPERGSRGALCQIGVAQEKLLA